jgi:hypothetical protein
MAIIRAILAGERDPKVLSELLVHRARLKKDLVEMGYPLRSTLSLPIA